MGVERPGAGLKNSRGQQRLRPRASATVEGQPSLAGAIVVAAGASTRMDGVDKTFASLGGVPLIARTVAAFESCADIGAIVLVVAERNLEAAAETARAHGWTKVVEVCSGGLRRQDSVARGLRALPDCEWVVVHDGARPLVEPPLVSRGLEAAGATGCAVAAVPSKDAVKVVGAEGSVESTLDRSGVWLVQTPQVFRRELLERAHREVSEDVTDDASMVERLGLPVRVFMGSPSNLKVTTPEDLLLAEALLGSAKGKMQPG